MCTGQAPVTLSGRPYGGIFTGDGMNGKAFNPDSAGIGRHAITYSYSNEGCGIIDTIQYITVNPLPQISFTSLPAIYCSYGTPINLSAIPPGGIFMGNGVSADNFYPDSAGLGSHLITYQYTDSNGCSNTFSQIIFVDACLSVNETDAGAFKIFPNPSSGKFIIQFSHKKIFQITITNLSGQTVIKKNFSNLAFRVAGNIQIDLSREPKGIYIIQVVTDKEVMNQKIILE